MNRKSDEIMNELYTIRPIAHIRTDFNERFGIPRQAGLAEKTRGRIVFTPQFRDLNALRGIEGFSHLWLIWGFTETRMNMGSDPVSWAPTVAPPRLGGRTRVGVFATRSPYRPNSLGLSCVRLLRVETQGADAPCLIVSGADILDGSPVYDIKPYLPYADSHPEADGGYAVSSKVSVQVEFPEDLLACIAPEKREALLEILRQDPRASYEKQPGFVYGLSFADYDIRFTVEGQVLKVFEVCPRACDSPKKVK